MNETSYKVPACVDGRSIFVEIPVNRVLEYQADIGISTESILSKLYRAVVCTVKCVSAV